MRPKPLMPIRMGIARVLSGGALGTIGREKSGQREVDRPRRGHQDRADDASQTASPPTIVATARPLTRQPSKGVLRERLRKSAASMVHSRLGSMMVTSPA